MSLFGQYAGLIIGAIMLIKAGHHLDRMSISTNHFIRLAYYLIAIGGAALVLAPFSDRWMLELGWLLVGTGAAIFMLYGRRDRTKGDQ